MEGMDLLRVLDSCAQSCTFPMLDNGHVYLAATRLSLFGSAADWALVVEVFGFSPRAGLPDLHVHTGDVARYRPTVEPNTHWLHWPDGGRS